MLGQVVTALGAVFSFYNLLAIFGGTAIGIILGALPGMTATMGVALGLPLTFTMAPMTGILFLMGIYKGGIYGGSITAILIKTPGTPAASATVLDGYELTKKGRPKAALDMALYASVFADITTNLSLILCAAPIAQIALKFGPPEYAGLIFFSLTIISSVAGRSLVKGLLAGFGGMLIATIGQDVIFGLPRFTFGSVNATAGLQLIPVLIGLFAIPEVLEQVSKMVKKKVAKIEISAELKEKVDKLTLKEWRACFKTVVRGSLIGVFMGAVPGVGAAPSAFVSYDQARRFSKKPEEFGHGALEGVAASESANNGVCGSTLIPLLTVGVPGDAVTAVLLGALMMHGLTPGPLLFKEHAAEVYVLYVGIMVASLAMFLLGKLAIHYGVKIRSIPIPVLFPVVFVLCVVGSFAVNNSLFDVQIMLIMGIVGFLMNRFEIPPAPLVIGFILGPIFESGVRRSLLMSQGSISIFFTRPICVFFIVLAVLSLVMIIRGRRKNIKKLVEM